jgi:hypothetical protein
MIDTGIVKPASNGQVARKITKRRWVAFDQWVT